MPFLALRMVLEKEDPVQISCLFYVRILSKLLSQMNVLPSFF
ncbi:GSCOCG00003203001-RA-CDS [Cotesia congregata]|nr:GSCOCG00003203001-RA-CDS [Cotesia congregata]